MASVRKYEVNVHIKSLTEVSKKIAERLITSDRCYSFLDKPFSKGVVIIDYPLGQSYRFPITNADTIGELLWRIAQIYKRIYKSKAKYGVWGHAFDDLWFERVTIKNNDTITLDIGS